MHATPTQALQTHFATVAGSDFEVLEPIVEVERAKREMETGADHQGSEDERGCDRVWVVGDEGGMGVIDVGETASVVMHVSKTPGAPSHRGI